MPRAVWAWISTVGKLGWEGELPGVENSYFSLNKNENSYDGALTIQNELVTFEGADALHVAASVGVALGIEVDPISEQLKKKDLTNLGKSIDLLVKTEIIKKLKKQKELNKKDDLPAGSPGPAHKPAAPFEPEKPVKASKQVSSQGQIPKSNLALGQHQIRVSKAELEKKCEECGEVQTKSEDEGKREFVGCLCYKELSKNIKIESIQDGYLLKFDDLDEDAISSLIEFFKD